MDEQKRDGLIELHTARAEIYAFRRRSYEQRQAETGEDWNDVIMENSRLEAEERHTVKLLEKGDR